ncbi:MAG: AI-2E family transporter, partial [Clostridia bacterium]|nr:AI-2E family transporter [Clostridia bacterium]
AQSVRTLAESMPAYLSAANENITQFARQLGLSDNLWETIRSFWEQFEISLSDLIKKVASTAIDATVTATKAVINFLIGIIFAAYMLYAKEKLVKITKKLCYAIFKAKAADKIIEIAAEANVTFSRFIGGQLLEAVILGVLCFVGMLIIGIPYAPLIACLVMVAGVLGVYYGLTALIGNTWKMSALATVLAVGIGIEIYGEMILRAKAITLEEIERMPKGKKLAKLAAKVVRK